MKDGIFPVIDDQEGGGRQVASRLPDKPRGLVQVMTDGNFQLTYLRLQMTGVLVKATKRSERPKRQLFIYTRTEADSPLSAQLQPLTETAPECVSCLAHTGQTGADSVLAARRRKGPHSTARVL